jgi:hypothetical protein
MNEDINIQIEKLRIKRQTFKILMNTQYPNMDDNAKKYSFEQYHEIKEEILRLNYIKLRREKILKIKNKLSS